MTKIQFLGMDSITTHNSIVHFNDKVYTELNSYVLHHKPSTIFILVDTNTQQYCLPRFLSKFETNNVTIEILEIPAGEVNKTLDICTNVWAALSEHHADRKCLIINLGGGVVTDLGGFVASAYMRGIDFINTPTSLLAMVDASVGGKTGVDLGALKNQIGVFNEGTMVLIDVDFLQTLPYNQLVSGFAEMLKHGLIKDKNYWETLIQLDSLTPTKLNQYIYDSVLIKENVVSIDQNEQGLRKILNFGHTLGHAIESHYLNSKNPLLHGEAIAVGMILEAYLSTKTTGLTKKELYTISKAITKFFKKVTILENDYSHIIKLLLHDKKNSHGSVNFVLLKAIGQPIIDCKVENQLIVKAFDYYNAL